MREPGWNQSQRCRLKAGWFGAIRVQRLFTHNDGRTAWVTLRDPADMIIAMRAIVAAHDP